MKIKTEILSVPDLKGGFYNIGDLVKMKGTIGVDIDKNDFGKIESIAKTGYWEENLRYALYIRWNDGELIRTPVMHFNECMELDVNNIDNL